LCDSFVKEDLTVKDPSEVVKHFNDFFVGIGDWLASSIPATSKHYSSYLDRSYVDSFTFHFSDANEIIDIVGQLADKSSFGVDNIPVSLIKQCITDIAEPISFIINCAFCTGCFPSELKIAKVCPIYKGGSRDCFSNYRPISILAICSNFFLKAL